MKRITSLLLAALTLTSCQNSADNARVAALTDLAITYATATGKITPADAALIRDAKTIILPASPTQPVPSSAKQTVADLQP